MSETNGGNGTSPPTTALTAAQIWSAWKYVLASWVVAIGIVLIWDWKPLKVDTANFEWFALLFVLALAVERLIEPFAGRVKAEEATGAKAAVAATKTEADLAKTKSEVVMKAPVPDALSGSSVVAALAGLIPGGQASDSATIAGDAEETAATEVSNANDNLAQAQGELAAIQTEKALIAWAMASSVAVVLCALLGAGVIEVLSGTKGGLFEASNKAGKCIDFIVTGMIVGAGTKPLHDLVSKIQKSKEKDDPQTGGAS